MGSMWESFGTVRAAPVPMFQSPAGVTFKIHWSGTPFLGEGKPPPSFRLCLRVVSAVRGEALRGLYHMGHTPSTTFVSFMTLGGGDC